MWCSRFRKLTEEKYKKVFLPALRLVVLVEIHSEKKSPNCHREERWGKRMPCIISLKYRNLEINNFCGLIGVTYFWHWFQWFYIMELQQTQWLPSNQTPPYTAEKRPESWLQNVLNYICSHSSDGGGLLGYLQAFLERKHGEFFMLGIEEGFWESPHLREKHTS